MGFIPPANINEHRSVCISALQKRWKLYAQEVLYCYDIPGLPPDNLQIESLFGRLRRHQRRISGRKSTRELRDFGQAQVLFIAESEVALLEQIRHIPQLCLSGSSATIGTGRSTPPILTPFTS